jgi:probable HAF family extracellular repeat protein
MTIGHLSQARLKNLLFISLLTLLSMASHAYALDFSYIKGEESADYPYSMFSAISADGSTGIGMRRTASNTDQAFRWTADGGVESLVIAGEEMTDARLVSDDGSVIIIESMGMGTSNAYRWTEEGVLDLVDTFSWVNAMSSDGSTLVGGKYDGTNAHAIRWDVTSGTLALGTLAGDTHSNATGIADNGTIIGISWPDYDGFHGFRWTEGDGMQSLGDLDTTDIYSTTRPEAISKDGSIIVGMSTNSAGIDEAFRWTEDGGIQGLVGDSDPELTIRESWARLVSDHGEVIVGHRDISGMGREAFRWTEDDGMVGLEALDGFDEILDDSFAVAISATGDVIVGGVFSYDDSVGEAVRWTEADGVQSISSLLIAAGVDLMGFSLEAAQDVSADGSVIVGTGRSNDEQEAWIVRLNAQGSGDDTTGGSAPSGLMTMGSLAQSAATMLPVTESGHALAQESLTTHLRAGLHSAGSASSKFNMYASGFGGEWNSYTVGGTLGASVKVSDAVRFGGGLFASRYIEEDLPLTSEYHVDSHGVAFWADYGHEQTGLQLQAVAMVADLDNDIQRGYLNGAGINTSTANPDGNMQGFMLQAGWKQSLAQNISVTPYLSYTLSKTKTDSYTETGGAFPAHFNKREDTSRIVKVGLEAETKLTNTFQLWGQAAYGKRLEDNSAGISGKVVGLMDFSLPGYTLDRNWLEADLGLKWQATPMVSVMTTIGGAAESDQQPDWRSSVGVSLAF